MTPDVDAIADWLGAMDESKNHFDHTDEATTWINIPVETLAERIAERLGGPTLQPGIPRPTKAEAEVERLREGVKALDATWTTRGYSANRNALRGLLDEDGGA